MQLDVANSVFFLVFLVGLGLLGASFVIGELFSVGGHITGEISHEIGQLEHGISHSPDHGTGQSAGVDHDLVGEEVRQPSKISAQAFLSGMTTFGGVALISHYSGQNVLFALLIGTVTAIVVTVAFYKFVVVPIANSEGHIKENRLSYQFLEARVTTPIPENGYGEVVFISPRSKARVSENALSSTGERIERDSIVTIQEVRPGNIVVVIPTQRLGLSPSLLRKD